MSDVSQQTEYNLTLLQKFIEAFNNGYNVTEACHYAGVSRTTYYDWLERIPGFSEKCEEAKLMINRKAKEVIVKSITDGDPSSAKWWLERKDPDFKNKAAVEIDPNEEKIEEIIKGLTDDPANQPSLPTTAQPLQPKLLSKITQILRIFHDADFSEYIFTYTQKLIIYCILFRAYPRIILILPTQYGKSLAVAFGVLLRVATHAEKWAIIAPTEDKARIIMDYIIEHVFDSPWLIKKLEYNGTKEKLKQERSKTRITFRGGGEVRVYSGNASNPQATKKALMGFGSPNIVLDESGQISDDLYSTVKRMLGGSEGTPGGTCLIEIGNPFYKNHFWRMWNNNRYVRVFVDYIEALKEGRYTEDYIAEMRDEAFFDVLYGCHFPEDNDAPAGYRALLSNAMLENAMIKQELPLGHDEQGNVLDSPTLGIDPNHGGSNYTVMTLRYPETGFAKVLLRKRYEESRNITAEIGADAVKFINDYQIDDYRTVVDAGGVGAGLADWFEEKGYYITPVLFGQSANNKARYANMKAELFWELRKWIMAMNGKLLEFDGFLELKEINYKETSTSKLQMETKQELAARNVESPDVADSLALTFVNLSDIADDDDVDII